MSGVLRVLLLVTVVVSAAMPARAQNGNIDAGKTPAQLYASSCAVCHKSVNEVKGRASANFLRQHYTTSREEAAAMAAYVQGAPGEPRTASRPPASPVTQPTDTATRARKPPPAGERTARTTEEPTPPPAVQRRPGRTDQRPTPPKPAPIVTAAAPPEPPAAPPPPARAPEMLLPEDTPPLPPNVKRALLPEEMMSPPVAPGPAAATQRFEE